MECLILSDEMAGFSTGADTGGVYQEDTRANGAKGMDFGGGGHTNELLSTSIVSEKTVAPDPPSSNIERGFDLHMFGANPGSSLLRRGGAEVCTPGLAPTFPYIPNGEMQAVVVQTPETLLAGPEFRKWRGTDGASSKDELAVEDWLEVHALFNTGDDP